MWHVAQVWTVPRPPRPRAPDPRSGMAVVAGEHISTWTHRKVNGVPIHMYSSS